MTKYNYDLNNSYDKFAIIIEAMTKNKNMKWEKFQFKKWS